MHDISGELANLRRENARLRKLLKLTDGEAASPHGTQTAWFDKSPGPVDASSSPRAKVEFFAALFGARREVPSPRFLVDELAEHMMGKQPEDLAFAGIRNPSTTASQHLRTAFSAAARATMTLYTYGHLFEDRLDEVGDALTAPGKPPSGAETASICCPCAPALPQPDSAGNAEGAPPSVSAGQDPFSDLYPRRDSNPRYRLERATEE